MQNDTIIDTADDSYTHARAEIIKKIPHEIFIKADAMI